jgi:hypothetical protein
MRSAAKVIVALAATRKILPRTSMRLAQCDHFLRNSAQANICAIAIYEHCWRRLPGAGRWTGYPQYSLCVPL